MYFKCNGFQGVNHPSLYCLKKPAHLQCALQNYGHSRYVKLNIFKANITRASFMGSVANRL